MEFWDLHYSDSIIVKDGGDIFRRKLVRGVADQQTGLSNSTVAYHDASDHSCVNY